MTYCVGIKLNAGLVFLSDSRTNAGVDNISTYRKMIIYEKPGERFMVLQTAGNLSISQSVREILQVEQLREDGAGEPVTIWNATSMFDACRVLGQAVRHVYDRDAKALQQAGVEFNVNLIFGGQIRGEGGLGEGMQCHGSLLQRCNWKLVQYRRPTARQAIGKYHEGDPLRGLRSASRQAG